MAKKFQTIFGLLLLVAFTLPLGAQRLDKPFESPQPNQTGRVDLLTHDKQWTKIATKVVLGGGAYLLTERVARAALPQTSEALSNEIALLTTSALCVGLEARDFSTAAADGVASVRDKRTDAIWDAVECSLTGLTHYLGTQAGWKESILTTVALLFLDWHFLPERDLRR